MAARPMVDLPAPDSPISPSTSPRRSVRSTPLTIGCQRSSLRPSMQRPFTSRSVTPAPADGLVRSILSLTLILESAGLVKEPIHDEVDGDGEERDRARRQKRRYVAIVDERGILADHRPPVRGRRLNAEAEERQRSDRQEHEAEPEPEFRHQRREDVRQDLACHDPADLLALKLCRLDEV